MPDASPDMAAVLPARRRWGVEAYYRLAEAGILDEGSRVELIEGELIDMAPIGPDHAATVGALNEALVLACHGRAYVSVQNPVRLDGFSEPQPDIAVCRLRADKYRTGGHPGPADVLLLVEVSDTSLRFDRGVKLPLYAKAGIPEVWIVDLERRVLEVHRDRDGEAYRTIEKHGAGARVTLSLAPELGVVLTGIWD